MHNPLFSSIEKSIGGRLGVALVNSDGVLITSHRAQERFALCSTFKAPLASSLFAAHKNGTVDMYKQFALTDDDKVPYMPFVEKALAAGTSVSLHQLAGEAIKTSDNAAANLILRAIGGPEAFTRFMRANGDGVTRLDRVEPYLNENALGDPRDSTTPLAMAQLLKRLAISDDADGQSRTIQQWMMDSITGDNRIRAGLPDGWPVGDKTGTAPGGTAYNDVAIIWPSRNREYPRQPVILTVYVDRPTASARKVDAAIADVARSVVKLITLPD